MNVLTKGKLFNKVALGGLTALTVVTALPVVGMVNNRTALAETVEVNTPQSTEGTYTVRLQESQIDQEAEKALSDFMVPLDKIEEDHAKNYPVTMAINEYVIEKALNKKFLMETETNKAQDGSSVLDNVQKGIKGSKFATLGGSAGGTIVALHKGHQALALAGKAQELKQAAMAAAQAGQYQDALVLGGQAKATGKSAMKLGKKALQAAKVAKILTLTSGGLAIVDGGINLYRGTNDSLKVNDLKEVAHNAIKKATSNGDSINEAAQKDFESVMKQLEKQEKKAHKQLMVGGIKEGCGGALIASAFMGPAGIPLGVGASITYVGVSLWEHWGSFSKFVSEIFTTQTTPEFDEAVNKQREKEAISGDWTP